MYVIVLVWFQSHPLPNISIYWQYEVLSNRSICKVVISSHTIVNWQTSTCRRITLFLWQSAALAVSLLTSLALLWCHCTHCLNNRLLPVLLPCWTIWLLTCGLHCIHTQGPMHYLCVVATIIAFLKHYKQLYTWAQISTCTLHDWVSTSEPLTNWLSMSEPLTNWVSTSEPLTNWVSTSEPLTNWMSTSEPLTSVLSVL